MVARWAFAAAAGFKPALPGRRRFPSNHIRMRPETKAIPKPAAKTTAATPAKKRERNFSPAALAGISAGAKARLPKAKASGKRRLG